MCTCTAEHFLSLSLEVWFFSCALSQHTKIKIIHGLLQCKERGNIYNVNKSVQVCIFGRSSSNTPFTEQTCKYLDMFLHFPWLKKKKGIKHTATLEPSNSTLIY